MILLLFGLACMLAWLAVAAALIWLVIYVIVRAVRRNRTYPTRGR